MLFSGKMQTSQWNIFTPSTAASQPSTPACCNLAMKEALSAGDSFSATSSSKVFPCADSPVGVSVLTKLIEMGVYISTTYYHKPFPPQSPCLLSIVLVENVSVLTQITVVSTNAYCWETVITCQSTVQNAFTKRNLHSVSNIFTVYMMFECHVTYYTPTNCQNHKPIAGNNLITEQGLPNNVWHHNSTTVAYVTRNALHTPNDQLPSMWHTTHYIATRSAACLQELSDCKDAEVVPFYGTLQNSPWSNKLHQYPLNSDQMCDLFAGSEWLQRWGSSAHFGLSRQLDCVCGWGKLTRRRHHWKLWGRGHNQHWTYLCLHCKQPWALLGQVAQLNFLSFW